MKPIELKAKISGRFVIEVCDKDGNVKQRTDEIDNLILDNAFELFFSNASNGRYYASVGTDGTAAAVTQVALGNRIGDCPHKSSNSVNSGASPYYTDTTFTYEEVLGGIVGTIAEVGIGWFDGTNLFSRAVISPALVVTSEDVLRIHYTYRLEIPEVDDVQVITVDGVSTTITVRPIDLADANEWRNHHAVQRLYVTTMYTYKDAVLAPIGSTSYWAAGVSTDNIGALGYADSMPSLGVYEFSHTLPVGDGNDPSGISGILLPIVGGLYMRYAMHIDPPIMKTSDDTLSFAFRITVARA